MGEVADVHPFVRTEREEQGVDSGAKRVGEQRGRRRCGGEQSGESPPCFRVVRVVHEAGRDADTPWIPSHPKVDGRGIEPRSGEQPLAVQLEEFGAGHG